MELRINPILEALSTPLTTEEDKQLDQSLEKDGQWSSFPLTVAPDGDVCDGMNRFKKLTAKGITPNYVIDKTLDTLDKKKIFVLKNNLARRHLNNWQKGQYGIKMMQILDPQNCGYKAETVRKEIPGLKLRTFEKVIAIDKKAPEHIRKKLETGSLSLDSAYKIVTQKERNLPKVPAPEGEFDVILCDVPLAFDNDTIRGAAANHYPTMTVEELKAFKVPSAKNCIMFFWISPTRIDDGKEIIKSWGFDSKDLPHFIWPKDKWGNGSWMRNQHEDLLLAVKGKMPTPAKLFSSIIEGKVSEHSKKPEIYNMIEEMYPKRTYLELFSRFKDSRKGWSFHGNELDIMTDHKVFKNPPEKVRKAIDTAIKQSKKPRKKKDITLACADCLEVFHSKEDLKEHKDKFCKGKVHQSPIDKIRNSRKQ